MAIIGRCSSENSLAKTHLDNVRHSCLRIDKETLDSSIGIVDREMILQLLDQQQLVG